ncbi:hypothetical protein MZD04_gp258 [Pseudomonas phage Psa21]|uniref:Uncharacterized protein n=1 Tax=Pseudomonas phage Psa21 TaxID=2530023 RepID=A0A481W5Y1_9CAUD|nr:hypothetical protein MZD04_gp258 [Pseudomonas phage Psa21]QBJ02784.1 hypothetical protein PSA21_258 [Pseudomonas phage Psa21]
MQVSNKPSSTPVSELGELDDYIGRSFLIKRNNQVTCVKLEKVKRRVVYLTHPGRDDGFTVPIEKFREYYHLLPSSKV